MRVFHTLAEWRDFRASLSPKYSLGFAPTMGNLHEGHLSLFKRSKAENDFSVTSLFINPTQFNERKDYNNYPRTLDADIALLKEAGLDYCLLPTEEDIYPDGYTYQLQENELSRIMEGLYRPGHFQGVLTIVMKLFQLIKPKRAYFGEKDYQQYQLIRDMVHAFFLDIQVIPCSTIRESSGLAFSSRNNRLSQEEKLMAHEFARIFHEGLDPEHISQKLTQLGIKVEYITDYQQRRYAAVYIGNTRLIDNFSLCK